MKFFHISDLHIGRQLHHYSLLEEQKDVLKQIVEFAEREQIDAVLIAGDIYDTSVPSAEAVAVFDEFLTKLNNLPKKVIVCAIAGNHDSAKRLDFASSILAKHRVLIAGMPPACPKEKLKKVTLQDEYGEVTVSLLPFVRPAFIRQLYENGVPSYEETVRFLLEREEIDTAKRNVIVSHQFYTASGKKPETCDSEVCMVGGIENVDIGVLDVFDYAALGHIHKAQKVGRETARYCGTPFPYSVSEAGDEKAVTMVELKEKGSVPIIKRLVLTPLRKVQKITGTLEETLRWATEQNCHDYVSITLKDEVEVYRPKERLEQVYDHILEIKIDNRRMRELLNFTEEETQTLQPYEAFVRFFQEMNKRELTKAEEKLIAAVINERRENS